LTERAGRQVDLVSQFQQPDDAPVGSIDGDQSNPQATEMPEMPALALPGGVLR
jgi:hypothetical protein